MSVKSTSSSMPEIHAKPQRGANENLAYKPRYKLLGMPGRTLVNDKRQRSFEIHGSQRQILLNGKILCPFDCRNCCK